MQVELLVAALPSEVLVLACVGAAVCRVPSQCHFPGLSHGERLEVKGLDTTDRVLGFVGLQRNVWDQSDLTLGGNTCTFDSLHPFHCCAVRHRTPYAEPPATATVVYREVFRIARCASTAGQA